MTSLQPTAATGTDVVSWAGEETGLEDFDSSDLTMPRLSIDHPDAGFRNSQTDEIFPELIVILLGLHKSRLMWGDINEGDEKDAPLCKSPDCKHGFPNIDSQLPASKQFPWDAQSVYNKGDLKPIEIGDNLLTMPSLGCKSCHFKEWNTDPTGKKPWCSEEWTFPLLYQDPEDKEVWVPALFGIRRSGIKPARQYVTPFASKKTPIFTVATKLSLESNRRGSVKYCTPVFSKVGKTDPDSYQDYFDSFKSAQSFLLQYPMPKDDDKLDEADSVPDGDIEGNVIDAEVEEVQASAPKAARVQPEAAPEPEPELEPEEVTFSTKGKIKSPQPPVGNTAPAAGTVEIDDDEEPPF